MPQCLLTAKVDWLWRSQLENLGMAQLQPNLSLYLYLRLYIWFITEKTLRRTYSETVQCHESSKTSLKRWLILEKTLLAIMWLHQFQSVFVSVFLIDCGEKPAGYCACTNTIIYLYLYLHLYLRLYLHLYLCLYFWLITEKNLLAIAPASRPI